MRQPWTAERVNEVNKYMKDKGVSVEQASKDLKFSMAAYYVARKRTQSSAKRTYKKRVQSPITLELAPSTQRNKIVFIIADRSQARNILDEVF